MFWNRRLGRLEFRLERNWSDMFFGGDGVGGRLLRNFKASISLRRTWTVSRRRDLTVK